MRSKYSNHSRLVAGWHGVTFFAILAFWIGSFVNLAHADGAALYSASLLSVAGFIFLCFFVFVRMFALKAQDRAIRAEENLRHFVLTGKLLPASLRIGQIVALRLPPTMSLPLLHKKQLQKIYLVNKLSSLLPIGKKILTAYKYNRTFYETSIFGAIVCVLDRS